VRVQTTNGCSKCCLIFGQEFSTALRGCQTPGSPDGPSPCRRRRCVKANKEFPKNRQDKIPQLRRSIGQELASWDGDPCPSTLALAAAILGLSSGSAAGAVPVSVAATVYPGSGHGSVSTLRVRHFRVRLVASSCLLTDGLFVPASHNRASFREGLQRSRISRLLPCGCNGDRMHPVLRCGRPIITLIGRTLFEELAPPPPTFWRRDPFAPSIPTRRFNDNPEGLRSPSELRQSFSKEDP
jgi:hypothetical protein